MRIFGFLMFEFVYISVALHAFQSLTDSVSCNGKPGWHGRCLDYKSYYIQTSSGSGLSATGQHAKHARGQSMTIESPLAVIKGREDSVERKLLACKTGATKHLRKPFLGLHKLRTQFQGHAFRECRVRPGFTFTCLHKSVIHDIKLIPVRHRNVAR